MAQLSSSAALVGMGSDGVTGDLVKSQLSGPAGAGRPLGSPQPRASVQKKVPADCPRLVAMACSLTVVPTALHLRSSGVISKIAVM